MGDSMLLVARELNARRPDGIFAFSQGASAAAILLAATRPSTSGSAETEAMVTGLGLGEVHVQRFAVLVGPFLANDPRWAQVVQERRPTGTKVLIVTGEDDALVPVAKSESLAAAFDPEFVQVLRHPGGHMVPTGTGEFKRQLNEFIDSVMGVTVAA